RPAAPGRSMPHRRPQRGRRRGRRRAAARRAARRSGRGRDGRRRSRRSRAARGIRRRCAAVRRARRGRARRRRACPRRPASAGREGPFHRAVRVRRTWVEFRADEILPMSAPGFVHLRVHTEYSVSDSIVRIEALVRHALADEQPAIAVTDLANLFGWVKFSKAARASGIKPICGVDAWLTNDADRDRPFRMLLLARDRGGYLRLCELISRAWIENEYRGRGELRAEWFDERAADGRPVGEGLIALSGAQHGDVGQALLAGNVQAAGELAQAWARRFPEAWYLEVQRSGHPEAEAQTRAAAQLAARLKLPLVATHPVQFLAREDHRAHEARVCIAQGAILA